MEKATQEIDSMLENLSTCSSLLEEVDQALSHESIMEKYRSQQNPVTLKAIEYEAKIQALEECMVALKLNENVPVSEAMKLVRKLCNK